MHTYQEKPETTHKKQAYTHTHTHTHTQNTHTGVEVAAPGRLSLHQHKHVRVFKVRHGLQALKQLDVVQAGAELGEKIGLSVFVWSEEDVEPLVANWLLHK